MFYHSGKLHNLSELIVTPFGREEYAYILTLIKTNPKVILDLVDYKEVSLWLNIHGFVHQINNKTT